MPRKATAPLLNIKLKPVRYMKVPPFVEVMEVTADNLNEVAAWAGGSVNRDSANLPIIILRKQSPPYNKAWVGDLVVRDGDGNFRVAKSSAFFDQYVVAPVD